MERSPFGASFRGVDQLFAWGDVGFCCVCELSHSELPSDGLFVAKFPSDSMTVAIKPQLKKQVYWTKVLIDPSV
jgi:hypothetical protein